MEEENHDLRIKQEKDDQYSKINDFELKEISTSIVKCGNYIEKLLSAFDQNHFSRFCFEERFVDHHLFQRMVKENVKEKLLLQSFRYISDLLLNITSYEKNLNPKTAQQQARQQDESYQYEHDRRASFQPQLKSTTFGSDFDSQYSSQNNLTVQPHKRQQFSSHEREYQRASDSDYHSQHKKRPEDNVFVSNQSSYKSEQFPPNNQRGTYENSQERPKRLVPIEQNESYERNRIRNPTQLTQPRQAQYEVVENNLKESFNKRLRQENHESNSPIPEISNFARSNSRKREDKYEQPNHAPVAIVHRQKEDNHRRNPKESQDSFAELPRFKNEEENFEPYSSRSKFSQARASTPEDIRNDFEEQFDSSRRIATEGGFGYNHNEGRAVIFADNSTKHKTSKKTGNNSQKT